jgi:hypothetical protein
MELKLDELLSAKKGKFYLISSRERDIDTFNRRMLADKEKLLSRIIRGKRCKTKDSLIQEFSAALQFPYYSVGDNWDGFDECIVDLNWLPEEKRYFIFITNFNEVLLEYPEELKKFFLVMNDVPMQWAKENRIGIPSEPAAFNILFHCEPENEEICKNILVDEKIDPMIRHLKPFDDIK